MKPLIKVILTLSVLILFLQFFQDTFVFKRVEINQGEWWRLISSHLVHTNYPHMFLNLTGLWITGFLFIDHLKPRTFLTSLALLILCVGLGVYFFSPALMWYAGLSGALYGLFLVGALYAVLNQDYFTGIPLLILVPAKIIWDIINGASQSSAELIGVPVATDAHLYGMIGAFLISLTVLINSKLRFFN